MMSTAPAARWSRAFSAPLRIGLLACALMPAATACSSIFSPGQLQLEITADQTTASPADPVRLTVTARNVGTAPISWGSGSSTCQLHVVVRIEGVDVRTPLQRVCTADLRTLSLEPGESRTEEMEWGGWIYRPEGGGEFLVEGIYEVKGAAGSVAVSDPVAVEIGSDAE